MKRTTAIIVAAGSSKRMGFQKLTADLLGKPVLRWTLEAFDACPDVHDMIVVIGDATRDMVQSWVDAGVFHKPISLSEGGAERHLSVYQGLRGLPLETNIVAVHDGARPLITKEQITRCIEKAYEVKAIACARPVTETLKRANAQGVIVDSVERENMWIMETPQVFDRALLCAAYEQVVRDGLCVTDEVSALQHHGVEVILVENPAPNLKITYASDLELAAKLLQS